MIKDQQLNEANISQKPAIELLQSLGYKYIPPEKVKAMRGTLHNVLLKDILEKQLEKINSIDFKGEAHHFSNRSIQQAIKDLNEPLTDGIVRTNEKIYDSLMLGRSYPETMPDGTKRSFTLQYLDWSDL